MAGTTTGKQYFLGIKGVEFIWRGAWSDPLIVYKRHTFNAWDVQEGVELMYDSYVEQKYIKPVKGGWQEWGAKNPTDVKAMLDDYIWAEKEAKKTSTPKKKAPAKKTTRRV